MRQLTSEEKSKALGAIMPSPIRYSEISTQEVFNEFNNLAEFDLARGMLNHEKYCLVESIGTLEAGIEKSIVSTTNLDDIILTLSLQAFKNSKHDSNTGNIMFSLPPFSFAFSLLLSYHLILSHMSSSLSQDDTVKFETGSGILLVTDNIELLSHIWRTAINNNQLRRFFPIYTIQAGKFKPFNFNESKKERDKDKSKFDGSLPWLTIFRAYRNQMPDQLDKKPEVIILDFMPFRHRKRAVELFNWAKNIAKHVIVIAPLYDGIIEKLSQNLNNHVPINMTTLSGLQNFFLMDPYIKNDPITSSWSTQPSLSYLHGHENKLFKVYNNSRVNSEITAALNNIKELLGNIKTSKGTFPTSFKLLHYTLINMLAVVIPLEWYERTKLTSGEPTISEKLLKFSKIIPDNHEEQVIYRTLMPHFYQNILSVYNELKQLKMTPRGNGLVQIFKNYISSNKNLIVIVSDDVDYQELGIWIRSLNAFKEDFLSRIEIMSQSVWAKKQLNEIYSHSNNQQNVIILLNPWKQKYISAFHFTANTEVVMLDCYEELNLYKYQLKAIYNPGGDEEIWDTFQNLFNISPSDIEQYTNCVNKNFVIESVDIDEKGKWVEKRTSISKDNVDMQDVFSNDILLKMFREGEEEDLDFDKEHTNWEKDISLILNTEELPFIEFQDSIEVKIMNNNGNEYVVFLPTDIYIKIKRFNKDEIESVSPYELKKNDIWVRVKENKRKELFNEILGFASNTMVMKWIYTNVDEWKLMVNKIWQKFYSPHKYKKHIYDEIKQEVNANGGKVESYLTISNWINGDVLLVRHFDNIKALAKILDDKRFIKRAQSIYGAMKELWGIHVKLGRALGKIIDQQAMSITTGNPDNGGQWINLGNDLVIPLDDVINAIDLFKVIDVQYDTIYQVHPKILEKNIVREDSEKFIYKGLIKNEC